MCSLSYHFDIHDVNPYYLIGSLWTGSVSQADNSDTIYSNKYFPGIFDICINPISPAAWTTGSLLLNYHLHDGWTRTYTDNIFYAQGGGISSNSTHFWNSINLLGIFAESPFRLTDYGSTTGSTHFIFIMELLILINFMFVQVIVLNVLHLLL